MTVVVGLSRGRSWSPDCFLLVVYGSNWRFFWFSILLTAFPKKSWFSCPLVDFGWGDIQFLPTLLSLVHQIDFVHFATHLELWTFIVLCHWLYLLLGVMASICRCIDFWCVNPNTVRSIGTCINWVKISDLIFLIIMFIGQLRELLLANKPPNSRWIFTQRW